MHSNREVKFLLCPQHKIYLQRNFENLSGETKKSKFKNQRANLPKRKHCTEGGCTNKQFLICSEVSIDGNCCDLGICKNHYKKRIRSAKKQQFISTFQDDERNPASNIVTNGDNDGEINENNIGDLDNTDNEPPVPLVPADVDDDPLASLYQPVEFGNETDIPLDTNRERESQRGLKIQILLVR